MNDLPTYLLTMYRINPSGQSHNHLLALDAVSKSHRSTYIHTYVQVPHAQPAGARGLACPALCSCGVVIETIIKLKI